MTIIRIYTDELCKSRVDITDIEIDTLLEKVFASWFNTYVTSMNLLFWLNKRLRCVIVHILA